MNKIINYFCFVMIFLISIIDIFYGIKYEFNYYNFSKNSKEVIANIYQIKNNEDGRQVLYLNYYVNNKKYENILTLNDKNKMKKSTIKIYYDKFNPLDIRIKNNDYNGDYILAMGMIIFIIDMILIIRFHLKKNEVL
ncbi:MAG: hypothetical protein Q4E39_04620 [bacterium]|nr:hypothetical protein [bacterium]